MRGRLSSQIINGDCLIEMAKMSENSIDAIVTDPPYGINFMSRDWDHGIPGVHFWQEALRVAKPGAHMLAFGGTRTHHRLMVAIEDAGWEIRDTLMWVYGSGFPKSTNVSKQLDKSVGVESEIVGILPSSRQKSSNSGFMMAQKLETTPTSDIAKQWNGWGSALKPAWEPIIMCRKSLEGTIANNVQKWGTGAINIDGCRVAYQSKSDYETLINNYKGGLERATPETQESWNLHGGGWKLGKGINLPDETKGRFPANVIHDGSDEVLEHFPDSKGQCGDLIGHNKDRQSPSGCFGKMAPAADHLKRGDNGSAARFFYCAKASRSERDAGLEDVLGRKTPMAGRGQGGLKCKICGKWKVSGSPCICTNPEWETSKFESPEQKNSHPTVKPIKLLRYLCKLITPPGGTVLDPFAGSGSTGIATV